MKRKKIIALLLVVGILFISLLFVHIFRLIPITKYTHVSYGFNVGDFRELAIFYTYIFVGRVDSITGTEYKDGDKYGIDRPKTNYMVTPLLNKYKIKNP